VDLYENFIRFRITERDGFESETATPICNDGFSLCWHQARNSTEVFGRQEQGKHVPGSGVMPVE
jgi:hypothetical protein